MNPFGSADHRPFAGFGVELVFGRRPDRAIVGIHEVASGLACDCVCPACDRTLVARKGAKTAHHFAHHGQGSGCGLGLETNAHLWAKQVLERHKAIYLPAIRAQIGAEILERMKPTRFDFDSVRLETRIGDMVPDVILTKQGRDLIVEVFVTHRCDEDKIAKIRAGGVSVVEVDLSRHRTSQDEKAIERAMLKDAPRTWLFNPKIAETEALLRTQIAAKAKAKADALRLRAIRILKAAYDPEPALSDKLRAERGQAIALGRKAQITGPAASDDGFVVPPSLWRSAIFMRLVVPALTGNADATADAGTVMALIPDCLAPGLARPLSGPLANEVFKLAPDFVPPEHTVAAYLEELSWAGVLRDLEAGYYQVSAEEISRVRTGLATVRDAGRRREQGLQRVEDLVGRLASGERSDFDRERWRERPIEGFAASFDALAETGGAEWARFENLMSAAERMLAGGPPVTYTLGLPLEAEIERSIRQSEIVAEEVERRRRERLATEAANRVAELMNEAAALCGDTDFWLAEIETTSGLAMIELARRDEAGSRTAQRALATRVAERERRARAAEATSKRQEHLRREALKIYDDAHASVFLNSSRHELDGRSPIAACDDERGLRAGLSLLPVKRQRIGV
jgi:hypothetical protein